MYVLLYWCFTLFSIIKNKHNTTLKKKKRNVETAMEFKTLQILKKDIYGLLKVTITTSMSAEGQVEEPSPVEK